MSNWEFVDTETGELKNTFDELFNSTNDISVDDTDKELESPTLLLNLDEINGAAKSQAQEITERLSNYYFDERYLEEHPYIKNKIAQEIENIRRLLKMISINEAAQDALITNITSNAGKGSLYQSLTALQNTTLNIQAQLNKMITDIEDIFRAMQADCEKTFEEKDKEQDINGQMVVRGSRDFINELTARGYSQTNKQKRIERPGLFDNVEQQ